MSAKALRGFLVRLRDDDSCGQMAVELAVLMPVVIVVALIVFNLSRFLMLCASFDRICMDAILCHGVSPAGTQSTVHAVQEVEDSIARSVGHDGGCEVHVSAQDVGTTSAGATLTLAPSLTRFTCTLVVRLWPSAFVIAGVRYDAPLTMRHERSLVVDRYKSGVVR